MPTKTTSFFYPCLVLFAALDPAMAKASGDGEVTDPGWSQRQFRVVVFGSSTAAGAGASRPEWSWAGRLSAVLKPYGYTVYNRSISGTNTEASLARFSRDVEPLRPGYVVLATSVVNELILSRREEAARVYLENTRELIRRVEAIRAVPIVAGPIPNNAYDRNHRRLLRDILDQLEAEGVLVWDFLSAVDDGYGRWLDGYTDDGLHPTDMGHQALFNAIPVSFFLLPREPAPPVPPRLFARAWRFAGNPACQDFLVLTPPTALSSWTVGFWLSAPDYPAPSTVVRASSLVLRHHAGRLALESSFGAVSAAAARPDGRRTHVALSFNAERRTAILFVNGIQSAVLHNAEGVTDSIRIAGPDTAPGLQIQDVLLYRSPLAAEDIPLLFLGQKLSRSLEAWLPLNVSPYRDPVNLLPTSIDILVCRDAWTVVPAALTPQ